MTAATSSCLPEQDERWMESEAEEEEEAPDPDD